jgi:hypothetical protein
MAQVLAQRRQKKRNKKAASCLRNAYVFLISRAASDGFQPDAMQTSRQTGAMRAAVE